MAVLHAGGLFSTMAEARDLINRSVIDKGESYRIVCSNQKSHVICCRGANGGNGCQFYISASFRNTEGLALMQSWLPEREGSTHTHYSVMHLLLRRIATHIRLLYIQLLYEILSQDLAVSHLLFQRKEAVQRQGVFANKRDIGKGRRGARICGVDRKVTINVAVEQLMIAGYQRKERRVIPRPR